MDTRVYTAMVQFKQEKLKKKRTRTEDEEEEKVLLIKRKFIFFQFLVVRVSGWNWTDLQTDWEAN